MLNRAHVQEDGSGGAPWWRWREFRDHQGEPFAGPAAARTAGRQLPVPALGVPGRREDYRQLHRSRGDLSGRRRLLHDTGHVPAAEAGTEFIQFSPREQLAETLAAMRANAQRATLGG
jgi:hypothetical protein